MVPKLPSVALGCHGKSAVEVDLSDIIEPLQSNLLSSSAEENILPKQSRFHHVLSSQIRQFNQLRYDPWSSVDFQNKSQIYADLSKAFKNVKLASNVATGVEVSASPKIPDKLAHQ